MLGRGRLGRLAVAVTAMGVSGGCAAVLGMEEGRDYDGSADAGSGVGTGSGKGGAGAGDASSGGGEAVRAEGGGGGSGGSAADVVEGGIVAEGAVEGAAAGDGDGVVDGAVAVDSDSVVDGGVVADGDGAGEGSADDGGRADPCAVDGGGCDKNATCTPSGGVATCSCKAGFWANGRTCTGCTSCSVGEFAAQGCTATSNTVCSPCATCGSGQYASAACTATSNTVCSPCAAACDAGQYTSVACTATTNRQCVQAPSCAGGLTCNGESCCATINVPGGAFMQGGSPEVVGPAHRSTVSSYALDKYEVTVGRFRKFVGAYVSNTASAPAEGAGVHSAITGTGWKSAWSASLPTTQAVFKDTSHLKCGSPYNTPYQTWTDAPGTAAEESRAINCVSWYEALAFCIWDGGRLATESEWEYAAAGGSENRLYPWGSEAPDCTRANFYGGSGDCGPGGNLAVAAVGSYAAGGSKWGHADMAGNVWEWTFDGYAAYVVSESNNYASIDGSYRVIRGSDFRFDASSLRAACRDMILPDVRNIIIGVRCARMSQ